jgi:hypothetical protein
MLIALSSLALAQDGTFTASVDQSTVAAGEQFTVTFTVSGADALGAQNFRPPDFGSLLVLSGPNTSQSFQIVNSAMSGSVAHSYVVYARQPGKYTIGPASIDYKGRQLKTQPLQIEAVKGKPQTQQQQAQTAPITDIHDNLFVRAIPDRQTARQGEQITLTYRLFWRLALTTEDPTKAPTYEGFWAVDLDQPRQPNIQKEVYQGKQYQTAVIKRSALFATQSGNLKIDPLEVTCGVQMQARRRSNDPFDVFNDPFFQQYQVQQFKVNSNPLVIKIDPLPPSPPEGFSGAVGKYTFTATLDKRAVQAGDPITLRLTIAGTGNVSLLTVPKPVLPSDIESYEPKVSVDITKDGGIIGGKKTAEYLLVPRNAGERAIEPVPFAYYDVAKRQYVRMSSPRFNITITPGKGIAGDNGAIASKEDIRLLGEDIRYLKLSPGELQSLSETPWNSSTFYLVAFLPPFAFIGAFVYRMRMKAIYGDMPKFRFQRAGKEAARRLKQAKRLLAQGNTESYHAEISKALLSYLEDKLHIEKSSLTLEGAVSRLQQRGVDEGAIAQLKSTVERAEFARFAPSADTSVARKELLDAAVATISAIEKSFGDRS